MISFTCGRCAKPYHLDDALAGKKARCKACGNEFRIPDAPKAVAAPKAAASAPAFDPYGLAEPAPSADPFGNPGGREPFPRVDADEDDMFAPPRAKILLDKPKSRQARSQESAAWIGRLLLVGLGLVVVASLVALMNTTAGAVAFIFPGLLAVGMLVSGALWLYIVPFQEGIAQGLMNMFVPIYPIYYLVTRWDAMRRPLFCYGAGALLLFATIGMVVLTIGSQEERPPRVAFHPARVRPDAGAQGGPVFDAGAAEGDRAAPGDDEGGNAGGEGDGGEELTLRGARMWRDSAGPGPPSWNFLVNYKTDDGRPKLGGMFLWVIDSGGMRSTQRIFRLDGKGTLSGSMSFGQPLGAGPHETYLATEQFGPGGPDLKKISNTIAIAVEDAPADKAADRAMPTFPGMSDPAASPPTLPGRRAAPPGPADRPAATAEDVPDLLADLKVVDGHRRRSAADELARVAPDDARRPEVVAALTALFDDSDGFVRLSAAKALRPWGTADQIDTWIGLLDDESFVVRWEALAALGELKDPRGAEAVAERVRADKIKANESLRAMGPAAEPAVLGLLADPEWSVRMDACKILGEIGTEAGRSRLKKAARDSNGLVRMAADEALRSIGKDR